MKEYKKAEALAKRYAKAGIQLTNAEKALMKYLAKKAQAGVSLLPNVSGQVYTEYITRKVKMTTNEMKLRYKELMRIAESDTMLESEFDELMALYVKLNSN